MRFLRPRELVLHENVSASRFVLFVLLASLAARGDATLPEMGPVVIGLSPLGARQGETLDVQFLGRNLEGTGEITFARPDIKAKVVASDFFFVQAHITVGPEGAGRTARFPAANPRGNARRRVPGRFASPRARGGAEQRSEARAARSRCRR